MCVVELELVPLAVCIIMPFLSLDTFYVPCVINRVWLPFRSVTAIHVHEVLTTGNYDLAQLDEDDDLENEEESQSMDVLSEVRLQKARSASLDESFLKREVLVRLGLGWFGGVISHRTQQASGRTYGYRLMLKEDQITLSVKLPLTAYSTDANVIGGG